MVARTVVALVAVGVLGWFAVLERDTRRLAAGRATLEQSGREALARGEADLRAARLLNPDRRPDIDRALVLRAQGRTRAAVELAGDVVESEPDNLFAWGVLYLLAQGEDPAMQARALAAIARLDPLRPRPG